jgi:hypothetical protein
MVELKLKSSGLAAPNVCTHTIPSVYTQTHKHMFKDKYTHTEHNTYAYTHAHIYTQRT